MPADITFSGNKTRSVPSKIVTCTALSNSCQVPRRELDQSQQCLGAEHPRQACLPLPEVCTNKLFRVFPKLVVLEFFYRGCKNTVNKNLGAQLAV